MTVNGVEDLQVGEVAVTTKIGHPTFNQGWNDPVEMSFLREVECLIFGSKLVILRLKIRIWADFCTP
jgi:hypothetical protein